MRRAGPDRGSPRRSDEPGNAVVPRGRSLPGWDLPRTCGARGRLASRPFRPDPGTVNSSRMESFLPSLVQMVPSPSQSVVCGRTVVTVPSPQARWQGRGTPCDWARRTASGSRRD